MSTKGLQEQLFYVSNHILSVSCFVYSRSLNKVALVRRHANPEIGKLTFPGGKVRRCEHYLEATKRELLEETGFLVKFPIFHLLEIITVEKYLIIVSFAEIIGQNFAEEDHNICWKGRDELNNIKEDEFTPNFIQIVNKGFDFVKMNYI